MVKRKRKSPIRHTVKAHVRENHRIAPYVRGKGSRTISPFTSRRKLIKTGEPKSFTINFKYSNRKGDGESVVVIARNYADALDEAFEEKTDARAPISIEVIDPSLKESLKILARGAGQIAKLGAKYTYVAGKTVAKEAAFAIARAYRSQKVRRLIEESYSPDRATRAMARAKLKTQYPELYSSCDFSKEKVSLKDIAKRQEWVRRTKAYY